MVRSGGDPQEALMALVPEAYRNHPDLMKNYPEVGALLFLFGEAGGKLGGSWKHRTRSKQRAAAVGRAAAPPSL